MKHNVPGSRIGDVFICFLSGPSCAIIGAQAIDGNDLKEREERNMTEREKALSGYLFMSGVPSLKEERERARDLCHELNMCRPSDQKKRTEILTGLIGNIKGNFTILSPFYCDYGTYITIGNNFFANYDCKIIDGAQVTFGDDVRIGPNCCFATANHALDPQMRKAGYQIYQPITVGNNVWFGANVTVLPGVTIGDDVIIGGGSVVTRDIPAGVLAAGNPCKVIRPFREEDREKYPVYCE